MKNRESVGIKKQSVSLKDLKTRKNPNGGLTKTGLGTLQLVSGTHSPTGSSNTYTGATIINNGT
jgi:hypothetical protein